MGLKVLLLQDLPLEKKHGATEGRVFECTRVEKGRGALAFFLSDAGEECGAYIDRECVVSNE